MPVKYKDPECPTISYTIGTTVIDKALLDLGASVNLLSYSVYKQLGVGELKPTKVTLQLADTSVKVPLGEIADVLIKLENSYSQSILLFLKLHRWRTQEGRFL